MARGLFRCIFCLVGKTRRGSRWVSWTLLCTPIKETERRRGGFEDRYGQGAVELDTLEALYPGELQGVLSGYMNQYYDATLDGRVEQVRSQLDRDLEDTWQQVSGNYAEDIQGLQQEYAQLQADFAGRMESYSQRLKAVWLANVGIARRKGNHPLQRYLNEVFPACDGWHARWDIFTSAADAFKGFPHLPRTTNLSLCTNVTVQPNGVSFTLYCPLPLLTQGLQAHLNALPFGSNISRENFLTLLQTRIKG